MENYRESSHTVYDLKYHIVWITKYRKPILTGDIAARARELIREICKSKDIEIIKGHFRGITSMSLSPFLPIFPSVNWCNGSRGRLLAK